MTALRLAATRSGSAAETFSAAGSTADYAIYGVNAGGPSSLDKYTALVQAAAIGGVTALGVAYFIFVRSDGTVLVTLCSVIGGLAGYKLGRKKAESA